MYKYILTLTLENDQPLFVMADHISHVWTNEDLDTFVSMTNGERFTVQESAAEIADHAIFRRANVPM